MDRGRTVTLPTIGVDQEKVGSEVLGVEELSPNRYRLIYSPGLVEGLAAGDEFELTEENSAGFSVLRRSGNLCAWLIFDEPTDFSASEIKDLEARVKEVGGYLDGGTHRSLIFTIPLQAGFKVIEETLDAFVRAVRGTHWFYGNVYDPKDPAKPLNWWLNEW
jgi:Domain of unknown function (DUF4265)